MERGNAMWRTACMVVALFVSASGADALDCAKASTPLERAICGSPSAASSDLAMVTAFDAFRARLGVAEQRGFWTAALTDQRIWLKKRNGECGALESNEGRARCAERLNLSRTRILTGRPEAGPGLSRQPIPFFARQSAGPGQFELEVRVYRFDPLQSDAERLVNEQADEGLRGVPAGVREGASVEKFEKLQRVENWTLSYGSPRLLSIKIDIWEYNNTAHGWDYNRALNLDLTSNSEFAVASAFDASGLGQLTRFCLREVDPESARPKAGDDPARMREVITSTLSSSRSWVFGRESAVVDFGVVDGYAAGHYTCEIPYAALDPLAKRPYR